MHLADCQKDSILQEIWLGIPSESTVSTWLPSLQTLAIKWDQLATNLEVPTLTFQVWLLRETWTHCSLLYSVTLFQGKGYKLDLTEGRDEKWRIWEGSKHPELMWNSMCGVVKHGISSESLVSRIFIKDPLCTAYVGNLYSPGLSQSLG